MVWSKEVRYEIEGLAMTWVWQKESIGLGITNKFRSTFYSLRQEA